MYSTLVENINELVKESKPFRELTFEQKALQKMSEEVFGIEVKYFESTSELYCRFNDDRKIVYLNGKTETSLNWIFWQEAFHVMKKHELEFYDNILTHIKRYQIFSSQQIEIYRKTVQHIKMKTGRRVISEISKENRSLVDKVATFTKKFLAGVKKFFHSKEVKKIQQ